jgi:hypothetical protein
LKARSGAQVKSISDLKEIIKGQSRDVGSLRKLEVSYRKLAIDSEKAFHKTIHSIKTNFMF